LDGAESLGFLITGREAGRGAIPNVRAQRRRLLQYSWLLPVLLAIYLLVTNIVLINLLSTLR
jgi:hypothetical protein